MGIPKRPWLGPMRTVEAGARIARIEVFFDLVFVYGFFNLTRFVSHELTGTGLAKGMLALALLWLCWIGHMLVAQRVRLGEGFAPMVTFVAMGATLGIGLTIPHAFADGPGVPGPLLFPVCYFVLRAVHVWLHWRATADAPLERRQVRRLATAMVVSTCLLLLAGLLPPYVEAFDAFGPRAALWGAAVLVEYGTGLAVGLSGWRIAAPTHFIERFELIVIIALGESIISIGLGSGVLDEPITWPVFLASVLGVGVTATLWWAYFDIIGPAAELTMHASQGPHRFALARDAYIYLHLPMIAGVILLALGGERLLAHIGDQRTGLMEPLPGLAVPLLFGGIALYLAGLTVFQLRVLGTVIWTRVAAIVLLTGIAPWADRVPVLVAVGLVGGLCVTLVGAEIVLLADSRNAVDEIVRHEREAREAFEAAWRRSRHRRLDGA